MSGIEKTLTETEIFKGNIFTVKKREVLLQNSKTAIRELVFHNGGAGVLPIDKEGNVYLIKQYRTPFGIEVLEIPAGKLEKGEDPFEAAKRELREETGFTAQNYISLGETWPTVGYCNEKIYIYLAQDLKKGETDFDEDEVISCAKMPLAQAVKMCLDGQIKDSKTLVAILKADRIINEK